MFYKFSRTTSSRVNITPAMSGPPNVANGRVREPMRFGRGACAARPVTSIGGPLNRTVKRLFAINVTEYLLICQGKLACIL